MRQARLTGGLCDEARGKIKEKRTPAATLPGRGQVRLASIYGNLGQLLLHEPIGIVSLSIRAILPVSRIV